MRLPTVRFLWIGNRLSAVERLSMKSFVDHGHPTELYAYGAPEGVPDGVRVQDASAIIPRDEIFTSHRGGYAIFSDWFRFELLFQKGGIWADADMVCLKPIDLPDEALTGWQDSFLCAIGLIKLPPGHALARHLADQCMSPNRILPYDGFRERRRKLVRKYLKGNRRGDVRWGEAAGPEGFTRALRHFGLLHLAKPFHYFYPVQPKCWRSVFDESFARSDALFRESYALHLWNEAIRKDGRFDKSRDYHPESLFARLLERHGLRGEEASGR